MTRGRPPKHIGCTINACQGRHYARGLCRRHYNQAKTGNTRTGNYACDTCDDRFASQSALTMHARTHRTPAHLVAVPDLPELPDGQAPPARAPMSAWDALLYTFYGHTTGWHSHAACRAVGVDPAWFHPARGDHTAEAAARTICGRCPVRDACLRDALATPSDKDHGIRGGLSVRQRRAIRNKTARGVG